MRKILCTLALMLAIVCMLASCNIQIGTPSEPTAPTIEISEDGYWVINGEKTDVKAQGEKDEEATKSIENPQELAFYLKDDGTYTVRIGNAKYLSKIEIPAIYKGKPVTKVSSFHSETLKEIVLQNGISTIDESAFYGCSSLTSITIPDSVTNIGDFAFQGCTSLTSITISDSVTSIGERAFQGCSSLISITFNGTIKQWKTIKMSTEWDYGTASYIVYFSDGTITTKYTKS